MKYKIIIDSNTYPESSEFEIIRRDFEDLGMDKTKVYIFEDKQDFLGLPSMPMDYHPDILNAKGV